MIDILFVNPSDQQAVYQGLSGELTAFEPPIQARMLAAYMRTRGAEVAIVDCQEPGTSPGYEAAEIEPRLVVVVVHGNQPSASTQTMPAAIRACAEIKENLPDTPLLVVGGHPAALPERTLKETGADFVCTGEGPVTVEEALNIIKTGSWHAFRPGIPGIVYEQDGVVHHTAVAPNVKDIDLWRFSVGFDLLPMNIYRAHNWHALTNGGVRSPYASIYTSFGCPYKCNFCMIQTPFREADKLKFNENTNSYRLVNAKDVLREILILRGDYGVRNIKIADEMFVLHPRHVTDICDLIIGNSLDFNIWAYARVDTVRAGLLPKLKKAGVNWLALGIESASEHVRDGVDKADYGKKEILETCRIIREEGISIIANFIFGLPDDTRETMEETLSLALEILPEWANLYPAMAYPGSRLYDLAIKEGWALPSSWLGFSMHAYDTTPLATRTLAPAEVLEFRDSAFTRFFTAPAYHKLIREKFGEDAIKQVEAMTAKKLPRRLLERELA
jgi:anaerobic magnesium-protoporphyrin IX monomethyl ester cyclase